MSSRSGSTPDAVFLLIEAALVSSDHLSKREQAENVVDALGLQADSLHLEFLPRHSWWESDNSEITGGRVWRCKGLEYEPKDPG